MSNLNTFYTGKKAAEMLKVNQNTLRNWSKKGKIEVFRTPGNKRMYNLGKLLKESNLFTEVPSDNIIEETDERLTIGYIRVSSLNQVNELRKQKEEILQLYPGITIIEDISSGLTLTEHGIKKVIDLAVQGKIKKLVVSTKDRLARFSFDLINNFVTEYSEGTIVVIHKKEEQVTEEELVKDVTGILNVYASRLIETRKYNKTKKPNEI